MDYDTDMVTLLKLRKLNVLVCLTLYSETHRSEVEDHGLRGVHGQTKIASLIMGPPRIMETPEPAALRQSRAPALPAAT